MSRVVLLSTGAVNPRSGAGGLTLEATAVGDDGALDPERLSQMAAVVNQLAS